MNELEKQRSSGSTCVPKSFVLTSGCRPLILRELDTQVKEYILKLRAAGGVVNTDVVMTVMHGIVLSHARTLLDEHGGHLKISKTQALSLLNCMDFVMRKGSTSTEVIPADFENIRAKILSRIKTAVTVHSIPSSVIVNSDETRLNQSGQWKRKGPREWLSRVWMTNES